MRPLVLSALLALGLMTAAGCDLPASSTATSVCAAADYPDPATSDYVLPYPTGMTYFVLQGNCGSFSHTPPSTITFAYDLTFGIGDPVTAARAGTVVFVEEQFEDGTFVRGEENGVAVDHGDGTWAFYVHFTRDGAAVELGDVVAPGDTVGFSGNSGFSTRPHLHFDVRTGCPDACDSVPVTFRNADDNPHGLLQSRFYTAR